MKEPDKLMIDRWMAGRLEGAELDAMEQWAEAHPSELEEAMGWGAVGKLMKDSLPASVEPPYAEFFNHKVEQSALGLEKKATEKHAESQSVWQRFRVLWATAAVAGMAVCFYVGQVTKDSKQRNLVAAGSEVYIPQEGVTAEVIETGNVTVIALTGLDEIPETLDIVNGETSIGASREFYVRMDEMSDYF